MFFLRGFLCYTILVFGLQVHRIRLSCHKVKKGIANGKDLDTAVGSIIKPSVMCSRIPERELGMSVAVGSSGAIGLVAPDYSNLGYAESKISGVAEDEEKTWTRNKNQRKLARS